MVVGGNHGGWWEPRWLVGIPVVGWNPTLGAMRLRRRWGTRFCGRWEPWRGGWLEPHLRRDETAPKMGHPVLWKVGHPVLWKVGTGFVEGGLLRWGLHEGDEEGGEAREVEVGLGVDVLEVGLRAVELVGPGEGVAVGGAVVDVDVHVEHVFAGDDGGVEPGAGGELVPQVIAVLGILGDVLGGGVGRTWRWRRAWPG